MSRRMGLRESVKRRLLRALRVLQGYGVGLVASRDVDGLHGFTTGAAVGIESQSSLTRRVRRNEGAQSGI